MNNFIFTLHNNNGDNMNLDIRENVISKIKGDNEEDIVSMINESVITGDELVLPGLGVMIELFWNELSDKEKSKIAKLIKNNINK